MSETVLIVDDDATVRGSIGSVLGDEGFAVVTAAGGEEALARLAESPASLVLLDVWMPDMDGIELLSVLRRDHPRVPVIVISGHGTVEVAVRATQLGAVDFIEKPFSIEGLLAAVHRALEPSPRRPKDPEAASVPPVGAAIGVPGPPVVERTLGRSVVSSGLGLHSGVRTGLILHPLPAGSGIRFGRVSGEGQMAAHLDNVESTGYATTLYKDGLVVRTVEHLMAALHAYGVTNLLVKVEGEVPILDGSAVEFCELIESAGVEEQASEIPSVTVDEEVRLDLGPDRFISLRPADGLRLTYELVYPEPIGSQTFCFELDGPGSFREQIAPARTFGFVEEIHALERAGLGQGGKLGNFILISEGGVVNTELRFPEELARHKVLDLLGDLYLLGAPVRGEVHARKTGHSDNIALLRKVRDSVAG